MKRFFMPRSYRFGDVAAVLAGFYLLLAGLVVFAAAMEAIKTGGPAPQDGSFVWGFAMLATMPLSLCIMLAYSAIASANGVPMADQDAGWWTLAAFVLCALGNAFVIWVIFRGRRVSPDEPEPL